LPLWLIEPDVFQMPQLHKHFNVRRNNDFLHIKQRAMKQFSKSIVWLLIALFLHNASFPQDSLQVITNWLKSNSFSIQHLEPNGHVDDLKPLKPILKDVKVFGLGEATHGTREFHQMKHRLLQFVASDMNVTALVLESSYAGCLPINDYVLTGKGDLHTVITEQGYVPWDMEEFTSIVEWIRKYNHKVPERKKIKIYGIDLWYNDYGRKRVLTYLEKYAPERFAATDSLFKILAVQEKEKFPLRTDTNILKTTLVPLDKLLRHLNDNKSKLIKLSSLNEWKQIYQFTKVMQQWVFANVKEVPSHLLAKKFERGEYMAQNMLYLMENELPGTKFIISAHNGHIMDNSSKSLGRILREKLGTKYYALAFECNQGTYQSREVLPDKSFGNLKPDTILVTDKSIAWYLTLANKGNTIVNLRTAETNPFVNRWLETPKRINSGSWAYMGSGKNHTTIPLKNKDGKQNLSFDGILLIERSTPSTPTKNALVTVEKKQKI
jgi:erythromycin esterase